MHVVWEKFCRYFDVEPRIIPLQPDQLHDRPRGRRAARRREHDRRRRRARARRSPATPTTSAASTTCSSGSATSAGSTCRCTSTAASGGFVWPFLYPDSEWDFRLEQVRSINVSGHKFGLVYPGVGWLIFREPADLAEDLVFYENYLGKTDATFTLNFSTGSAMVLAQYYNFVRLGHEGYRYIMETMQENARVLATRIAEHRAVPSWSATRAREQLPLVAFQLAEDRDYDEFDVASQLAAERGWMVPAYTLPPNAEHVTIMRALVKQTLGRSLVITLAEDLARGVRDARPEGRAARARPQARQDRHRLLKEAVDVDRSPTHGSSSSRTARRRRRRCSERCSGGPRPAPGSPS